MVIQAICCHRMVCHAMWVLNVQREPLLSGDGVFVTRLMHWNSPLQYTFCTTAISSIAIGFQWIVFHSNMRHANERTGNLGGLCGVISGFSLITVVEIIYFILKQIYLEWKDLRLHINHDERHPMWREYDSAGMCRSPIYIHSSRTNRPILYVSMQPYLRYMGSWIKTMKC